MKEKRGKGGGGWKGQTVGRIFNKDLKMIPEKLFKNILKELSGLRKKSP